MSLEGIKSTIYGISRQFLVRSDHTTLSIPQININNLVYSLNQKTTTFRIPRGEILSMTAVNARCQPASWIHRRVINMEAETCHPVSVLLNFPSRGISDLNGL